MRVFICVSSVIFLLYFTINVYTVASKERMSLNHRSHFKYTMNFTMVAVDNPRPFNCYYDAIGGNSLPSANECALFELPTRR